MKSAHIWTEEVAFVDCPHCGETEELGSGLIFDDAHVERCPKCQLEYFQYPPPSDEDRRRMAMDIGRRVDLAKAKK